MAVKSGRLITLMLVFVLLASISAGCGGTGASNQGTTTAAASTQASVQETSSATEAPQEPLIIKHFYDFSWYDDNYANTTTGQELQKRCNVRIEISKSPTDDEQKLNIMVASGELPDMITLDKSNNNISKMIEGNMIYAFTDLVDQYAPDIRKNLDPEILTFFKQPDGKQYFYPSFVVTPESVQKQNATGMNPTQGGAAMSVMRSDVYEAIGKPDMSTPDGFFNALVAAKQKFPKLTPWYFGPYIKDYNLFKAPEWQGSMSPAAWMFGLTIYEQNGDALQSCVRDPKFLDYIKFMNKLYTNKLIDPTSFADSQDVAQAKIQKGNYSVMTFDVLQFPDKAKIQDNPDASWVPLPYFTGGKYFKDGSGWTATVISKKTADPERLMKFIQYCTSEEGAQLIAWGIEGKDWDWKDVNGTKLPRYIGDLDRLWQTDWGKFTKDGGYTTYFAFDNYAGHSYATTKALSEKSDYEKKLADLINPNYVYDPKLSLLNPDGNSPEGIIQTKLMALATTYYPKMIMAKDEASAIATYNEFMKKCEDAGLAKLEAAWTTRNNQMK